MATDETHDALTAEQAVAARPLAGRTALVTGAGRGLGRAVALGLADAATDIVLVARSQDQLNGTSSEITARGRNATAVRADLADLLKRGRRPRPRWKCTAASTSSSTTRPRLPLSVPAAA